jgi:protein-S-isoprenylcysteine O-methyltransferase Ste14
MKKLKKGNKIQFIGVIKDIHIVFLAAFLLLYAYFLVQQHSIFPDKWFPSHFATIVFMFLLSLWILSEFINSLWSKKNSQTTNKDKGSYKIVVAASYVALFIVFLLRTFNIGVFSGSFQYVGFILIVVGILLREWAIYLLGHCFTTRVQVHEETKLVTQGPYKYIRHPAYTGILLTFAGIPLAVGTWLGIIIAFIVKWIAIEYRISVEEEALKEAFGSEYEEYKKSTWKLFPIF